MAKKEMNVTMVVPDLRLGGTVSPGKVMQVLCAAFTRGDTDGAEYCCVCVKRNYCIEFFANQVVPLVCGEFVFDLHEFAIMQREEQDRRMEALSEGIQRAVHA